MISRFFIDRPIFATVLSIVITLTGAIALFFLPIAQYPRITPPGGAGLDQLPGGQRPGGGRHGGRADRAAGQRRPGHAVHVLADGQRRLVHADGHVRHRHRSEHGPGHGAEPRGAGHAAVADPGAEPGDHDPQEDARHLDDRQFHLAGRPLRRHLPEQLRHDLRPRRVVPRGRGFGHHVPGPARLQHPRLARSAKTGGAQHDRDRRGQRDPQPEYPSGARTNRRAALVAQPVLSTAAQCARPAERSGAVRRHHRQGPQQPRRPPASGLAAQPASGS